MRRLMGVAAAGLLMCLVAAGGKGQPAPTGSLDEIVVTGERAGPSMWHVHRGDAHVWLLGSLTPLPRGITWRSHQVEHVLDSTAQVLVQKPFEVSIPRVLWVLITDRSLLLVTGGKRLKDVMPADLHERFSALRSHYTEDATKWERYRPIVAALFLQQAAFHQVGLSMRLDLGAALRILAKEKRVRVEEVKMAGTGDMLEALKTLPAATEKTCVQASLVTIESAMPRLMERARAWADGDIEKLQNLPVPAEVDACRASLDAGRGAADLITRMRQSWVVSIEKYLQKPGSTIAVVNFDLLLERGGILEQLRDAGYQIDPP